MYDCVYPTRTARFGTALVPEGVLKLKGNNMVNDDRPIDPDCDCMACKKYTRGYLHHLVTKEPSAALLVTYHNIRHMMNLGRNLRQSIIDGTFEEFVNAFLKRQFPDGNVPLWVREALEEADIDISSVVKLQK